MYTSLSQWRWTAVPGDTLQCLSQARKTEESRGSFEVQVRPARLGQVEHHMKVRNLVKQLCHRQRQADQHACQQIEHNDANHGGNVDDDGHPPVLAKPAQTVDVN